jgi:hypothetical protein
MIVWPPRALHWLWVAVWVAYYIKYDEIKRKGVSAEHTLYIVFFMEYGEFLVKFETV